MGAKGKVLAVVIWIFGLVSLGGALATTIRVVQLRVFAHKPQLHTPALIWLCASAVADVGVVVGMLWSLSRRKTGFSATDGMIDRIIRCPYPSPTSVTQKLTFLVVTIQTGLLTAILALADMICFLTIPHSTM
jgi:hypothetical protein